MSMLCDVRCWSFQWAHSGDTTVIRFEGEDLRLDEEGVAALAGELLHLGRHELYLDFRHVRAPDGCAVAMLRVLRGCLEAAGRVVRLTDFGPRLATVHRLEVVG